MACRLLERQAEEERIAAEKEAARRPRKAARRSQSTPPQKDKNGGELARGRGRQRINQTIGRSSGGSGMLERRSRSLMSKKDFRRSGLINSVVPAGGAVLSRCPEKRFQRPPGGAPGPGVCRGSRGKSRD